MLPGITGIMYRQFALTICIAVVISSINALTLSPALCSLVLKQGGVVTQHVGTKRLTVVLNLSPTNTVKLRASL
ncbi:efflux RND transporter permease subunit [Vibrio lentus]|nr:efflux RND transporter permease subunit [Vibrio lentus]